jgi:hypothetical protein
MSTYQNKGVDCTARGGVGAAGRVDGRAEGGSWIRRASPGSDVPFAGRAAG